MDAKDITNSLLFVNDMQRTFLGISFVMSCTNNSPLKGLGTCVPVVCEDNLQQGLCT